MARSLDLSPILCSGIKIESLPLTPQEGFVLSRINGVTSVREIISGTGLPQDMVEAALDKLEGLGAIEFQNVQSAAPRSRAAQRPQTVPPSAGTAPPASLDTVLRRIDLTYRSLQSTDHYRLLGVRRNASADDIKQAYVTLSREMHPDRFHKANVGDRKEIIETVFARISEAYEVLKDPEKRDEYNESLLPESARRERAEQEAAAPKLGADAAKITELAQQAMRQGDYHSALRSFKIAASLDPNNKELNAKRILMEQCRDLAAGLERYEQKKAEADVLGDPTIKYAVDVLEKAADDLPKDENLLRGSTELLLDVGLDIKLTRKVAEKLFRAFPRPEHTVFLGKVLEGERKYDDARRNYERALSQDPNCAAARTALQELKKRKR